MAKDKKLELFEVLAAKRAKGKNPLGVDVKPAKQANTPDPEPEVTDAPGLIIDDAVSAEIGCRPAEKDAPAPSWPAKETQRETTRETPKRETVFHPPPVPVRDEPAGQRRASDRKPAPAPAPAPAPEQYEPEPEPRPKSPREVVFRLDTALMSFTVVMLLVACSYFIGYKRGQEERPAGLAGVAEIDAVDASGISIRNLAPPPRAAMRPSEQEFTLIIRKEPASDELPERLELELAEALARGRADLGRDIPGFIFRTAGADPNYILAVGLGQTANDQELARLLKIYNDMEGITLSRQTRPYLGCRIAPIRELGTPVY